MLDADNPAQGVKLARRMTVNRFAVMNRDDESPGSGHLFDLDKSLGAFVARQRGAAQDFSEKVGQLEAAIASESVDGVDTASAILATQSGLSVGLVARLKKRVQERDLPNSIESWVQWTIEWLSDDSEATEGILFSQFRSIRRINARKVDAPVLPEDIRALLPGVIAWVQGKPIREIEVALSGNPTSKNVSERICPRARDLIATIIPLGLAFAAGLITRVVKEINPFAADTALRLDVVESLSTAIRRGYDTPEKLDFASRHPSILSRVQVHQAFSAEQTS